jgi:hypothetical protein
MSFMTPYDSKSLLKVIKKTFTDIPLDLNGIRVLTEAASGVFAVTPLLAALAGADHVYALGKDSRYGSFKEVKENLENLGGELGILDRITITDQPATQFASAADLVTNLNFVRPISSSVITRMPSHGAIALMWAPWEFRAEDLDLESAVMTQIPIVATNEDNAKVSTYEYVGILSVKLLLEQGHVIRGEKILVVGSNPFGLVCETVLLKLGAITLRIDPSSAEVIDQDESFFSPDVILIIEHKVDQELMGPSRDALLRRWQAMPTSVVHICGNIDENYLIRKGFNIYPNLVAPFGFMSATTGYLGLEPVTRLHAAGMYAAAIVVNARKKGSSIASALKLAEQSGFGLSLIASELEKK